MNTEQTYVISTEVQTILDKSLPEKSDSTSILKLTSSIQAILFAFIIGTILIMLTANFTNNPDGYTALTFYEDLYKLNFGNVTYLSNMLSRMSYLIPLGMALVVSFRMGIFNIGAAGQAFLGGTLAFLVGTTVHIGSLGFLVTIAVGVLSGMVVAGIIAFLKNKFKINEVISSIMLNWVILYLIMQFRTDMQGLAITTNNDLEFEFIANFFNSLGGSFSSANGNLGILLMIPLIIVFVFMYSKTKWGYKQNLIGNNPKTGAYLGVKSHKEIMKTMLISGGLAGFAGTVYLTGHTITETSHNLPFLSSEMLELPATSFDGITIALIGYNSPIGILFSSFLFSIIKAPDLDTHIGAFRIVDIIVGLMIIFISTSALKVKYGKKKGGK